MQTKILKISPKKVDLKKIKIAAEAIKKGCLVAFPTETVYGLGADCFNVEAVRKIFVVKKRPWNNPLIVHIANKKDLKRVAAEVPKEAKLLAKKFWPGPLTLVLKRNSALPKEVCAGLDTAAIRMPNHKVALALIKAAKTPIAAPSANIATKPSPTSAKDVIEDFYGKISVIIDSGKTKIGLESTIIDLSKEMPVLLRPGGITLEKLKKEIGKIKLHPCVKGKRAAKIKAPGMMKKHYAPKAKVILLIGSEKNKIKKLKELCNKFSNKKIGIIAENNTNTLAKNLFHWFREFDRKKAEIIIVLGVEEKGLGLAVMNRLKRAASKIIFV